MIFDNNVKIESQSFVMFKNGINFGSKAIME